MEFHEKSRVIASGHVAFGVALHHARGMMDELGVEQVLIAGTDSFLVGATLAAYEEKERLLTSDNSNGFIPGEAGTAILVEPVKAGPNPQLLCLGMGFAVEEAHVDSEDRKSVV